MSNPVNGGKDANSDILNSPKLSQPDKSIVWYSSQYSDQLYGKPATFSFTDVHATLIMPFNMPGTGRPPTVYLPGLTLISISEHRDVYPVVSMGRKGIKGFTTGHKTTAGTLGFNIFGENPFAEAMKAYAIWRGAPKDTYFTAPDELPPMDLSLILYSSAGDAATILIRSFKILDSSRNISVRDIQLTEVYSFMAANVTHLVNANDELGYTPNNIPKPSQNSDWSAKKSATRVTISTLPTITPPTVSTLSTTTLSTVTTTSATTTTQSTTTTPRPTTISATTISSLTSSPATTVTLTYSDITDNPTLNTIIPTSSNTGTTITGTTVTTTTHTTTTGTTTTGTTTTLPSSTPFTVITGTPPGPG